MTTVMFRLAGARFTTTTAAEQGPRIVHTPVCRSPCGYPYRRSATSDILSRPGRPGGFSSLFSDKYLTTLGAKVDRKILTVDDDMLRDTPRVLALNKADLGDQWSLTEDAIAAARDEFKTFITNTKTDIDDMRIAGPMHDIGKIAIPDYILRKPDTLTDGEWAIMKTHISRGADMLAGSDITMMQMAAEFAAGHHERRDGSGYPLGLAGDAIPLSARIVAIVDGYDAFSHKRVYKEAMLEDQVIQIMRAGRGKHCDPGLFDLFIENLETMRRIRQRVKDEK